MDTAAFGHGGAGLGDDISQYGRVDVARHEAETHAAETRNTLKRPWWLSKRGVGMKSEAGVRTWTIK